MKLTKMGSGTVDKMTLNRLDAGYIPHISPIPPSRLLTIEELK